MSTMPNTTKPHRPPVPTGVDEKVTPVTVVVHGAPQLLALPGDRDAACVQTPRSAEATVPSLHPPGARGRRRWRDGSVHRAARSRFHAA